MLGAEFDGALHPVLVAQVEGPGDRAVIHGLRAASNRKRSEEKRTEIVGIVSKRYPDFGPTQASEYLSNRHKVKVGWEALRQIRVAAGL